MSAPVVYIDIDGVVADSIPWWLALHNQRTGTRWTKEDIKKYEDARFLEPYFTNYDYVLPVSGAFESIGKITSRYRVVFATSGSGEDWLRGLLGSNSTDFEYIRIKSKYLLKGFALIDDYEWMARRFTEENTGFGIGVVLKQPWNNGTSWEKITEWLLNESELATN